MTLRSTLAAGSKPSATLLVIEASYRPVTGFVTVDNTLPSALGRDAFGIGVDFNSVLGAGEMLYLRASGCRTPGAIPASSIPRRAIARSPPGSSCRSAATG